MALPRSPSLLIIIFILMSIVVFGQRKVSPNFSKKSFKELKGDRISVSVSNPANFKNNYQGRVYFQQEHSRFNSFVILVGDEKTLVDLKNDSTIKFIDVHRSARDESALDFVNPAFNRVTAAHNFFPSLTGTNQNISIKELLFDTTVIDLRNRGFLTSVSSATLSEHATTMATLMAGAGNSSYKANGVASAAHFTSSDYANLFPDDISFFNSNQIHLQNHSYGVDIENYYGNEAAAYDQQVYENPTVLHVFSSGNIGKELPSSGTYQNLDFANLSGNFKQAKNVLIVNAVDSTLLINALNSRGPAFDGRLKPELTAYGAGGTSEASALCSGISLLIQEKYQSQTTQVPDASMVKAILIASADDLGPAGIDFYYGYGSINALNALKLVLQNQFATQTLSSNDQIAVPVNIPDATKEIKIAIVWNDPAAVVNSNSVLINDIDSWLTDGTTSTLPWVLSSYPNADSLNASAKRKADHLNNVEFISLNDPPQGSYQLMLKSGNLSGSTQKVSIAYWLRDTTTFQWDFPTASDKVDAKKKTLLVWQAQPNQTGDLFVQLNQGNWQLVQNNLDLNNYFHWITPDTLATAKLKIRIGTKEFISDQFIISPLLKFTTAFNCDSIGLVWNKINGATGYDLYKMGSQYLEKFKTTSDTIIVLPKTTDEYFTVAPTWNGNSGLKSETIDYTQQGAFCYFDLFSATRSTTTQVSVLLTLSSWHEINYITIYKTIKGVKSIYRLLNPSTTFQFSYIDDQLVAGTMTYQSEITFKNGSKLFSDVYNVQIEEKGKALLYPNPVSNENYLNVQSAGGGMKFKLLDSFGKEIAIKTLELVVETLDLTELSTGIYFYQIEDQGKINVTGKIIKL